MRSPNDHQTVIALRHRVQTIESTQRQAWRALDTFREHLVAAGMTISIDQITALLAELAAIRQMLSGAGEGGSR